MVLNSQVPKRKGLPGREHRTERESNLAAAKIGEPEVTDLRNSSLIMRFLSYASVKNNKEYEADLEKIQDSHKMEKPEEKHIFHMTFSQMSKRCFVFLADRETGDIKCVAFRESFLQEELRNPCSLGLKLSNLRGDYHNIF
jgi:hypothetical protein